MRVRACVRACFISSACISDYKCEENDKFVATVYIF